MKAGYAIVEVLLAIFLVAIGISTTAYMIPTATRGLTQSRVMTQAAFFAQMRMEEALSDSMTPAAKADPDNPLLTGEIRRQVYGPNGNLTYVQVMVYRTDDPTRHPLVELENLGG